MLITKETDYSLRLIAALASGARMTMGEICHRELIPQQFGYKILKKLAKAGLVEISRGNGGGCHLHCDLNEVTLYDLMTALESTMHISACMDPDYQCQRRLCRNNHCTVHNNLLTIQRTLNQELKKHTLAGIIGGREND